MLSLILSLYFLSPLSVAEASCNPCKCHIPRPPECDGQAQPQLTDKNWKKTYSCELDLQKTNATILNSNKKVPALTLSQFELTEYKQSSIIEFSSNKSIYSGFSGKKHYLEQYPHSSSMRIVSDNKMANAFFELGDYTAIEVVNMQKQLTLGIGIYKCQ